MRWMRDRHAHHPIQGEAGCGRGLQQKLAEARQLGTKNLNLSLTTTMNELLIGFGITSSGFDPLASAPSQEPTSWPAAPRPLYRSAQPAETLG